MAWWDVRWGSRGNPGGGWLYGVEWGEELTRMGGLCGGDNRFQFAPEEVDIMQSIGILDSEGIEIFEGDVVQCSMSFEGGVLPHRGQIVWHETFGAFATRNDAGKTLLHNHCLHTLKVIGNVHENPELMK